MKKQIDFNKIYSANNGDGEYIIKQDLGTIYYTPNYHSHRVIIKFLLTGYENNVELKSALNGSVRDNSLYDIDYNKIYESKSGPYRIYEKIDYKDSNRAQYVNVKFINTGSIVRARLYDAKNCKVKDPKYIYEPQIDFNKIYDSKYGKYKIIDRIGKNKNDKYIVRIMFLETKYEYNVSLYNAQHSIVKDPYFKSIFNIGYLGESDSKYKKLLYPTWHNMIKRCYNINYERYKDYGGSGVYVDESWHNFANFIEDAQLLPGFDCKLSNPKMYQLDKDYKQLGTNNKVYSKHTCTWVSIYDNSEIRHYENKNDNIYGVKYTDHGTYIASIDINGKYIHLGTFNNFIAACNAYNLYKINNSNVSTDMLLLNNVEYMSPVEVNNCRTNLKQMIKIIDNKK